MKDLKIGIITQARVGSTRLPGKTLLEVNNQSLLEIHLNQLKKTGLNVYLATTTEVEAINLIQVANKLNIKSKIGSLDDVLSRFYLCAKENSLDVIVRVTSDCPVICSDLILEGVESFVGLSNWKEVYMSNTLDRGYPRGLDFEIFSFDSLEWLHLNCLQMEYREHVTPFLYLDNKNENIKKINFKHKNYRNNLSGWRLCVDEKSDFELIAKILNFPECLNSFDSLEGVLNKNLNLKQINQHVEQKKV